MQYVAPMVLIVAALITSVGALVAGASILQKVWKGD